MPDHRLERMKRVERDAQELKQQMEAESKRLAEDKAKHEAMVAVMESGRRA